METLQNENENQTPAKAGFKEKWNAFFDRNYALFFVALIALTAYLVCLFSYKVYPFSDKYTVASYDLSAQICPFIEHLFDVLDGKSSLFYSYAIAGGADVFGTFLYFFVSPFSFLFLILGDGMVAQASSIVMACKIVTIAVAGTWFAKKLFQGIPDYLCIVIGLLYAYCGYTFVANTYINWMDFLIYMPFATAAFVRFVKTGSFWLFSVLVAACVYTCFSIACFSMFIAFPALVFYGLLCVEKEKRNAFLARLCLAFLTAILLALPVLLPALSAYMNSGRGSGLFDDFWYGFTVLEEGGLGEFSSSDYISRTEEAAYRKWSYILSDSAFVALTVVWFARRGLRDSFAKFMLTAGVLTLVPVAVDESMLLLNMGSYMSYALRFGFLNALYFLGGACLAIEGLCYKADRAYDGGLLQPIKGGALAPAEAEKSKGRYALNEKLGGSLPWVIGFGALALAVLGFLVWFISNGNYKTLWESVVSNSEWKEGLKSVSSRFAHSLGGAEVVAVFFVLVGVVIAVGAILVSRKKIGMQTVSLLVVAVLCTQLVFYNNQIVLGNRSTQHIDLASYTRLSETVANLYESEEESKMNGGYFRVKDYGDKLTANAPFTGGANSFSVFSSVIDEDNFAVGELFGYKGNGKNTIKSAHNTGKYNRSDEFGDAFMGYKYYFVHKDQKEEVEKNSSLKKYVDPVMVKDENGRETQLCDGNFFVYENTIVFPSAYKVDGGSFKFVAPNESNSSYRKENQAAFYEYLRGKTLAQTKWETGSASSDSVTVESARELSQYLWQKSAKIEVGAGKITARVQASAGEYLFLNFVASEGYRAFVNGKERELNENDLHFLCVALDEGENLVEFKYSSPYVKSAGIGFATAILGLCAVVFVEKKTKWIDRLAPVISWAGILLSVAVVAFFMIFPSATCIVKLIRLWL